MIPNWDLVFKWLIAALVSRIILLAIIRTGVFTGNRYKNINGKIYVKHPGGDWEILKEHMKQQKRLRENK